MIKGLDIGYSHTKDNDGRIFKSAFSHEDCSVTGSRMILIDDKQYYVGNGVQTSDADKSDSEINKVCTLYDMYLSGANDFKLCVGLPIAQYKTQRNKLKETILSYNNSKIYVNGSQYKFKINDVFVTMQGIASLFTIGKLLGEYIIIDIGGLTIDVSLVEFNDTTSRIIQSDTWYKGVRTLYSDIIGRINNKFSLKLDNSYGEKVIRSGFIRIDGKEESMDFLKPYLQSYIDEITEEIKLKYPYQTANIYLTGGGAIPMSNSFINRFHQTKLIANPQFSNAIGYYLIGCHKFKQ
jgi:hypothetical protein